MLTVSLNLNENENSLIADYVRTKGMELSEIVREALLEKIEEERAEMQFIAQLEKEMQTNEDYQLFLSTEELERELDL